MDIVEFNGWKNSVRLANKKVELIVTTDVGPRIVRYGFVGQRNVFAEIKGQQGGSREKTWMIRGGHRLWIAPEEKPRSYELDNAPVKFARIANGVRTTQTQGPCSGIVKAMDITLAANGTDATVVHTLRNMGRKTVSLAVWALSVMAPDGTGIIPLPKKISHKDRLTANQLWSIWGYTHLGDGRWTIGSKYLFFRQDRRMGPNKLGIACREGWAAYLLGSTVFVKRFEMKDGMTYPDGGVNFETFSNEDFLELESLGPLVKVPPGKGTRHVERWSLHQGIPPCKTEADVDKHILPLV